MEWYVSFIIFFFWRWINKVKLIKEIKFEPTLISALGIAKEEN